VSKTIVKVTKDLDAYGLYPIMGNALPSNPEVFSTKSGKKLPRLQVSDKLTI
jgi:hypothetical protein